MWARSVCRLGLLQMLVATATAAALPPACLGMLCGPPGIAAMVLAASNVC